MPRTAVFYPASPKQVAFIGTLAAERVLPEDLAILAAGAADLSKRAASDLITALLALPKAAPAAAEGGLFGERPAAAAMPEPGYYAVEYDGVLRFYRVVAGKGRWDGRVFLNRFRSDFEDRVYRAEREAVVAAIFADPQSARETFARETTHCWRCGRRLTDLAAAAKNGGLGPECVKMV